MASPSEIYETAVRYHRAGQLREAATAYRQLLAVGPLQAEAHYRLAMISLAQGEPQAALEHAREALATDPQRAELHAMAGEAQRHLGQLHEAVACYRRALEIAPDYADGHNNLGTLLQAQGDLPAAADCYRRAIAVRGDYALAHHNLGVALQLRGELHEAAAHYAEAARLNPAAIESQLALGYVLIAQCRHDGAMEFFADAVRRQPNSAAARCGLGFAFQQTRKLPEAIAQYRQAVALAPGYATAHYNLATALRNAGQRAEALVHFRETLRLDPNSIDARVGAAGVLLELGQPDESVLESRRAAQQAPHSHAACAQLAAALHAQGDLDGAIAANRRALEINPADHGGHSNLIYGLLAHEGLDPQTVFAEHVEWDRRHARWFALAAPRPANDRARQRRLRVGYVSAHFREHAVSFFSEPLIAAHDHERFEIVCYSDVRLADETTARFRSYADLWRETAGISDEALAQRVRDDGVDILVDLAGHIGGNRLLAFARRPAPIQVTYLGYQATTGMGAMDYRLTDAQSDPPGRTEHWHTERLVRLPRSFFCYRPPADAPEPNPLPALTRGHLTFASLNQAIKLRPCTWRTWARILAALPAARLLVLSPPSGQFARVARDIMAQCGVDGGRIEFVLRRPRADFLRLHHEFDVALDSFPCNGHTTVCDALWMGVPSIMLEGGTYATRFGSIAPRNLGLDELVADSEARYVEIAVRLAGEWQQLAEWRRTMRDRMRASPLLDAPGFTRNLEGAYRQMWHDWLAKSSS
ncbi:MAG: tetratricopeptide repeat protein [Pirellulales bacterium]